MPGTDDLTSALDQIKARGYHNGARGALCARLSDAAAVDVPRLLAAVKALTAGHEPMPVYMAAVVCGHDEDDSRHFENDDGEWLCQGSPCPPVCKLCTDTLIDPGEAEWPCGPYSIALRELTGEGGTDG